MSVAAEALDGSQLGLTSDRIRNVAIIAHVDHGKTTLVDQLLKQSGAFRDHQVVAERVLDSNDQERERGITIFSKNASVRYGGYLIDIVDTPGHADFGGQVERVLGSVDGALLIVDAFDGVMAQTRFVLKKALELGLRIIVVINKIDRPGCEPYKALDQVFDLFVELGATDRQLDFPHLFASARMGTCRRDMDQPDTNLAPLFALIVDAIPAPQVSDSPDPVMQITSLDYSEYTGSMAVGRLRQGVLRVNQVLTHIDERGEQRKVRIQRIMYPEGIKPKEVAEAIAGQIISVAGVPDFTIGDTLSGEEQPVALPRIEVDPATISMRFMVSDSPLCGTEGGRFLTSNQLIERLEREALADVALRVERTQDTGTFLVSGRGVLHLSVLIEKMRREGYEFAVGRPKVITKHVGGVELEPVESISVDVPEESSGPVIEEISKRKGEMLDMRIDGSAVRLRYDIPSRGLIGLRTRLLTLSKGYAVLQQLFKGYERMRAAVPQRPTGVLLAKERGQSVGYALWKLQDRGAMFIGPGVEVYPGMIVGEHAKEGDLVVNVTKGKQLTNMRTHASDDAILLIPPRRLSLEECLEFVNDDECVEVTPKSLRLRKIILDDPARRRAEARAG
jgi:GTP-binding protein